MGLAVAFIIGSAVTTLVQSLVNEILMPVITAFLPGGGWRTATFTIGSVSLGWGAFLGALINFVIIAFVIFLIVKMLLGEPKKAK